MEAIKLPINSKQLVLCLGMSIIEKSLSDDIGFEISGKEIFISKNSTSIYKSFVFAYIYIMKKKFNINNDIIVWRNDFNYPHYAPLQNNILNETMDLLVPPVALSVLINQRKIRNVNEIKLIFNVSLELLKNQLKRKNYI
jgi:hypothetical protein